MNMQILTMRTVVWPFRAMASGILSVGLLAACGGGGGGGGGGGPAPSSFTISAGDGPAVVVPDGSPTVVPLTVTRNDDNSRITVTVTTTGLPPGTTVDITHPGTGNSGAVSFTVPSGTSPSTTLVTITATDSQQNPQTESVTLPVRVAVLNTFPGQVGGHIATFLSTNLQPAFYGAAATSGNDYTFFTDVAGSTKTLSALHPQHLRTFPNGSAIPQQDANNWNFTYLDSMLAPAANTGIQYAGDESPLIVLTPPAFLLNANGSYPADPNNPQNLDPNFITAFDVYCANMVAYYNTTNGFVGGNGTTYARSGAIQPVSWWSVANEPNETDIELPNGASHNPFNGAQYAHLYYAAVAAMQTVPSQVPIKFVGPEVADVPGQSGPQFVNDFVQALNALDTGAAPTPVNALSVHHYGACAPFGDPDDTDAKVLARVTGESVPDLQAEQNAAAMLPVIPPIWIDENTVNADFGYGPAGTSDGCGGGSNHGPYVRDPRNDDAFFAAYRPYFFSQAAQQGGAQGIFHFKYENGNYGEVAYEGVLAPLVSGQPLFPYWVDYYLGRAFPYCLTAAGTCQNTNAVGTYQFNSTDADEIETLATFTPVPGAGSYSIMVVNHAVANPATDMDGNGVPMSVVVDVSGLHSATTAASLVVIDSSLNAAVGPMVTCLDRTQNRIAINFAGYGVAFITLNQ